MKISNLSPTQIMNSAKHTWGHLTLIIIIYSFLYGILRAVGYSENVGFGVTIIGVIIGIVLPNIYSSYIDGPAANIIFTTKLVLIPSSVGGVGIVAVSPKVRSIAGNWVSQLPKINPDALVQNRLLFILLMIGIVAVLLIVMKLFFDYVDDFFFGRPIRRKFAYSKFFVRDQREKEPYEYYFVGLRRNQTIKTPVEKFRMITKVSGSDRLRIRIYSDSWRTPFQATAYHDPSADKLRIYEEVQPLLRYPHRAYIRIFQLNADDYVFEIHNE